MLPLGRRDKQLIPDTCGDVWRDSRRTNRMNPAEQNEENHQLLDAVIHLPAELPSMVFCVVVGGSVVQQCRERQVHRQRQTDRHEDNLNCRRWQMWLTQVSNPAPVGGSQLSWNTRLLSSDPFSRTTPRHEEQSSPSNTLMSHTAPRRGAGQHNNNQHQQVNDNIL